MKEIKINNARPIQKAFTVIVTLSLVFLCLLGYILGEMYQSIKNSIIMFSIIGGIILAAIVTNLVLRAITDSLFIFDEQYITHLKKNNVVFKIRWNEVVSIGYFQILDFGNTIEWGPGFMGIDYLDENGVEKKIQVPFSKRNAKLLKESQLNSKLDNFI